MQQPFEKLAAFYLGKTYDPAGDSVTEETLLYDAKDLTTHAVCVGMTGSGKTGLCLSLLEEAAIDGIPTLAIDPKGDLGNLLLTFPDLRPGDFEPWIDPGEAARKGNTPVEHAAKMAALWKNGLASWGQDGERIARFRNSVDLAIYTPGSDAGIPLSVLRSFAAPPAAVLEDGDLLRERIGTSVSGLLALLGIDADPLQSREHILLSNILQEEWESGQDLDIAGLIQKIQEPPFERIGVLDLEAFYPAKDRFGLAMTLNNLLASPGFESWMDGDPLDIQRLLWTPEGKPRIAIISIAHLNEQERMFMVTQLLNEVLSWVRSQSGTTSLRALLYMDEVFGYFPPVANPPSKRPMLTLLKQARAYGLGVVLATQNPVDLDYKGLSNTGTWFLGRLQTERDKARVLDGLEGVSATSGGGFDRKQMDAMLSGLKSRVFLMNNVHDGAPTLFHTRWALSYLRGPLTRSQIKTLMAERKGTAPGTPVTTGSVRTAAKAMKKPASEARPVLAPGIPQVFLEATDLPREGETLRYRPALLAEARLHFVKARTDLDDWEEVTMLVPMDDEIDIDPWDDGEPIGEINLAPETEPDGAFGELPSRATRAKSYAQWEKTLKSHLYREHTVTLWKSKDPKAVSTPEETEADFRVRLGQLLREDRDLDVAKLHKKYGPKLERIQERMRKAEQKIGVQQGQYRQAQLSTTTSIGETILGALFGRKSKAGMARKASTSMRGAGRVRKEKADVDRAREDLATQEAAFAALEAEFRRELEAVRDGVDPSSLDLTEVPVRPRKADTLIERVALAWVPWIRGADGKARPAYE